MQPSVSLYSEIGECLDGLSVIGKLGAKVIQPRLAEGLKKLGYEVDVEDAKGLLRERIPVWRSKDGTCQVVETARRRRVDIVVYKNERLVALIEVESDLNDLRAVGVTKRNGHYDVASISKNSDRQYFDSYNSIERMSTAAYCWHEWIASGAHPSPDEVKTKLEAIASDDPADHNPGRVPLFLVSGTCRAVDHRVLKRRLDSLGATLICVTGCITGCATPTTFD